MRRFSCASSSTSRKEDELVLFELYLWKERRNRVKRVRDPLSFCFCSDVVSFSDFDGNLFFFFNSHKKEVEDEGKKVRAFRTDLSLSLSRT